MFKVQLLTAHRTPHTAYRILFFVMFVFSILFVNAQSNRLTNEEGQLLWQYNQHIIVDEVKPDSISVSFIFINGIQQTAITLRQDLFYTQIIWKDIADAETENEERVASVTANLSPHQAIVWKYVLKNNSKEKELVLEKSAILIMNEDFEVCKEIIPEQRFDYQK